MNVIGVDFGSRFIKVAINSGTDIEFKRYDTVGFYKNNIVRNGEDVSINLPELNLTDSKVIATGYGRNLLHFTGVEVISEIKAHFYGASFQTGENNFVLVDIGGQDSKVIQAKDGYINDFLMNDKCAASTGRFMEQAANILEMPMDEFMAATDAPTKLSDTCAVFCESEIIGQLARGATSLSLAAGVNLSVAKRIVPQIKRFSPDKLFVSGGAGLGSGLLHFISELTGVQAVPIKNMQHNGAIGCTCYGIKLA